MTTHELADMKGKIAVVTGATSGIGKEIARSLAAMGATVVIGARTEAKGEAARSEIASATGNKDLHVMCVDVAELESVKTFAAAFEKRFGKLHILVNNAGAWFSDRRTNQAGRELTFATNVLGPFALTLALEKPLRASAPSRVVNVVSSFAGDYEADDLDFSRRSFNGFKAYSQSKAALRMQTWAFAARFAGSGVSVNAAAPGFVRTDFNRNAKGLLAAMIGFSSIFFGTTPARGAKTPAWVATHPSLAGTTGKYFDAMKEKDGKWNDPAQVADLQRRCSAIVGEA